MERIGTYASFCVVNFPLFRNNSKSRDSDQFCPVIAGYGKALKISKNLTRTLLHKNRPSCNYTQINLFKNLLNQPEIRLYLPLLEIYYHYLEIYH